MKVFFSRTDRWINVNAIFSDRRTVTLYFQYNQIDLYPRTSTAIRQAVKCFNPYTGENKITFIKEH